MKIQSEIEERIETIELVNHGIKINEISLKYFNIIKKHLVNLIKDLSKDYVETTIVVILDDYNKIDLDQLQKLCNEESIDFWYNKVGYSIIIHAGYDLIESKKRIKERVNNLERKLINNVGNKNSK